MLILGIETTCDETGVAIVEDGYKVLSNVVASSVEMHQKYGGIVPEVAAREQIKVMIPVIEESLSRAKLKLGDLEAIAVAYGPGLIGSLLIGVETAKTLALVVDKPLVAVNHLIGHVYANWLEPVGSSKSIVHRKRRQVSTNYKLQTANFPLVALIVSGGHTDLILMTEHGRYQWLGGTLDDAAGEAFDKVAQLLALSYPGGPEIEKLADEWSMGNSKLKITLPRPMIKSGDFNFSFSGLKTAVVNLVKGLELTVGIKKEIAYEFQKAAVEVLTAKTIKAARKYNVKSIVIGGGVAANSELRIRMSDVAREKKINVFFPAKERAIDNGAMIAAAAFYNFKPVAPLNLTADPSLYFV